jgi:hypothetical protein
MQESTIELDSLYNILHLILFGVAMRMAYYFWRRKFAATSTTTTLRAIIPSRVARQKEISPDTSVEVNPVPPLGWCRMEDPPGTKGQAPLDLFTKSKRENEPSRGFPMFAIQTGVSTENPEESSLLHRIFNHTTMRRIATTLKATRGLTSGQLVQPICDSCVVTTAQRHKMSGALSNNSAAALRTRDPHARPASMLAYLYSLSPHHMTTR